MKIKKIKMKDFMSFENIETEWSPNINVICGENSTGKTTLLKAMYSLLKPISRENIRLLSKESGEKILIDKVQGIFRPEEMKIGRLVNRKAEKGRAQLSVWLGNEQELFLGFSNRQENHADIKIPQEIADEKFDAVYIPTKEMISNTEHFASLYEEYQLDFEETYYDLVKLLDRPLIKRKDFKEQKEILSNFEEIMGGEIIQKNKKFYLKTKEDGELEMGLLSDGYRKLATIIYLILSGSLNENAVLFWDEPEANMNPKMIRPIVLAMTALAKMGVQIFITTHDYFVQQEFNMMTVYQELNPNKIDVRFLSLYREEKTGALRYEMTRSATDLEHNEIMQEFDRMYDREQRVIYGD